MRTRNLIAALFLMVAGVQTAQSQKIIIHLPENQKVEYEISQLDSITFDRGAYLTCPDDKHPHAIDLGLPSGTKWCCCNVGATAPEGYGGHYAWGETSEKSVYDLSTYHHYNTESPNRGYVDIGSNIAGTSFDVARVRMGTPWRMPSNEQMKELINNCSYQWTQQNGINGFLLTGSNGGHIFLPAAGSGQNDSNCNVGTRGFYWSCSFTPYNSDLAYSMYFTPTPQIVSSTSSRYYGLSVRAVCP